MGAFPDVGKLVGKPVCERKAESLQRSSNPSLSAYSFGIAKVFYEIGHYPVFYPCLIPVVAGAAGVEIDDDFELRRL
jgi:hypothetical protein